MKEIKVTYLFEDRLDSTVVSVVASEQGVRAWMPLITALTAAKGTQPDVRPADFVLFDMATLDEYDPMGPTGKCTHLGAYPRNQTFMTDATPELMAKAFRFMAARSKAGN